MKLLIIDTSSILFGFSNKINAFEVVKRHFPTHRLIVSSGIIRELERIATNRGTKGAHAKLALSILKSKKINILIDKQLVDKWILGFAEEHHGIAVITNDSILANKLKKAGAETYKLSRSGILRLR